MTENGDRSPDSEQLRAGLPAVDEAGAVGEEAEVQGSDETTDEVDAHHIERVVEAELELQVDREGADRTGDDTEHDRPDRGQRGAGRGDRDEAGDGARCGADRGGLAVRIFSTTIQASSAAAGAASVLMNAIAAVPSAASSEPALKPNQPNHRRPAPRSTKGGLCGA